MGLKGKQHPALRFVPSLKAFASEKPSLQKSRMHVVQTMRQDGTETRACIPGTATCVYIEKDAGKKCLFFEQHQSRLQHGHTIPVLPGSSGHKPPPTKALSLLSLAPQDPQAVLCQLTRRRKKYISLPEALGLPRFRTHPIRLDTSGSSNLTF